MRAFFRMAILALTASFLFALCVRQQGTSLAETGKWMNLGIFGGSHQRLIKNDFEYMMSRNSLRGDHAQLGIGPGFQDLLYFEPIVRPKKMKLEFNLLDSGYFWFYLNCGEISCLVLRLSNHSEIQSILAEIDDHGKILSSQPINGVFNGAPASVNIEIQSKQLSVFVGDKKLGSASLVGDDFQVRIRAGATKLSVHGIEVTDSSEVAHKIGFDTKINKLDFTAEAGFALFSIVLMVLFIRYIDKEKSKWIRQTTDCLIILSVTAACICAIDRFFWSQIDFFSQPLDGEPISMAKQIENVRDFISYKIRDVDGPIEFLTKKPWLESADTTGGQANSMELLSQETEKFQLLEFDSNGKITKSSFLQKLDDEVESIFQSPSESGILILGGCGAWGAGASQQRLTWFSRLAASFASESRQKVRVLNLARCSAAQIPWAELSPHLERMKFNLTVLLLSSLEDLWLSPRQEELESLANITAKTETRVVFVNQPIPRDIELKIRSEGQPKIGPVLQAIAQKNHGSVIDMNEIFINQRVDSEGMLWFSRLGLTDYGQERLFLILSEEIKSLKL